MKYIPKSSLFALLALLVFSQFSSADIWTAGHGDIGIGYDDGALEPHWHIGNLNEEVTLDGVSQTLGAEGGEYSPAGIIPRTNLTLDIGGTPYYIFPFEPDASVPHLGIGTDELATSDWAGDIVLTLTGFSGPGSFTLYNADTFGPTSTAMSTADGLSSSDSVSTSPQNHLHHIWAFSQTGDYSLQFEITGMYSGGESDPTLHVAKSATATYGFSVVPEPSTAGLLLGAAALALTVVRRRVSQ